MRRVARITLLMCETALAICCLASCGGGGGGSSVSPTINYGSVDGYVYIPYGSPAARVAEATPTGYKPVAGAMAMATCGVASKSASTNSSGYFKIQTVPTGTCTIQIQIGEYTTTQYQVNVSANQTTRVGDAEGIKMTPVTHGAIRATANVAGGMIVIDDKSTNVAMPAGLVYTFSYVEPGAHTVGISKSGYETVGNQSVTVAAGQTVTVDFTMIPTGNRPPVADAGEDAKWFAGYSYSNFRWDGDIVVYDLDTVSYTLDGSGSNDPDGDPITYNWAQVGGPSVELSDISASKPVFIPTQTGTYTFILYVTDGYHATVADSVNIIINRISGKLTFNSPLYQQSQDIYTLNADGTGFSRVTTTNYYDGGPRWSPDGNKIMFTTNPSRDEATYYIATMNANGTGVNVLGVEGGSRAWSPDGNKLLITSKYLGVYEFYEMNPDGSNLTRISNTGKSKQTANYSPDGTQIVFAQELGYSTLEIYKINSDGTGLTKLTNNGKINLHPEWLVDGRILFTYNEDWTWETDLFVMNADGTGAQAWPTPVGVDNVIGPVMTNDGQFIFYTGDDNKIHVMYSDGSADLNLGIWGFGIDYHPGP